MARTSKEDLIGRAAHLTRHTGVVYHVGKQMEGYRLETALKETPISPRFQRPGDLMNWIDGAIKGAEATAQRLKTQLVFFNEGTTETETVSVDGEWQMLGRAIYLEDSRKVAEWDGGYWCLAHNNKRFRCFRLA